MAMNCWEFKKCGREPDGPKAVELGVCPATTDRSNDSKNRGKSAGRYCWKVAGTLCGGEVQGTWAAKMTNCLDCAFYKMVVKEEGAACQV